MSDALELQLAAMVSAATDGEVEAREALAETDSLARLGVGSLAYLRLIEAVERRYGVTLDLETDMSYLDTVESLAKWLRAQGVES
ncbi:MAG TPA: acyl carrier protein [Candidatus Limnocylindrales bacterium]|nr:acyl carrier protein [Candidatus Limnocylindrales bacterium]